MCGSVSFSTPLFFRFCTFPFPVLSVMRKSISGNVQGRNDGSGLRFAQAFSINGPSHFVPLST